MGKLPYVKGLKSYFPHKGLSEQKSIRSQHLKNLKESQCLGSEIRQGAAGSRRDKQRLPACIGKMQSVSFPFLTCLYLRITEKELHRGKGKQWHFTKENVSGPSSLTPSPRKDISLVLCALLYGNKEPLNQSPLLKLPSSERRLQFLFHSEMASKSDTLVKTKGKR